ncbi:cytochrome c4 [Kineobactrum sediminis]|uniref:Cytochrome c4 n=1 Tax=Kineobactrum sediminis TaxID=1905677 RepID=A0A2N5Y7L8_9GAMM|nr:c-type cytochrome [Kineobactrum sediminis]PLW84375.1 cytochrome c4 [Kineobactrum sediminis]
MKRVLVLCGVLLGLAQPLSAATPILNGDAAAGEALTGMCSACHGADGNSIAGTFPKLAGQGQRYLYKQLMDIRDGARPVPSMVGQLDDMTNQQLADIAAFYAAQQSTRGQTDPELLALGQRVYRAGVAERKVAACIACHSPTGKGNAPAGYPMLAGQHAEYIATQLRMYRKGYENPEGRTNDGDTKIMRSNAFGLSDMEIEAVASYVAGLN